MFRELDAIRGSDPVRVWTYASHDPERPLPPTATWTGRYVCHLESAGGAHPEGDQYRSPKALLEQDIAYWAAYWHVDNLRRLDPSEWRQMSVQPLLSITEGAAEKHISNILSRLDPPGTVDDHRRVLAALAYLDSGA